MNPIGIIPARYASTRFPAKPLIDISGKSMIQRVYEQAKKAQGLDKVVVATDDERIYNHVLAFGGEVVMTSTEHQSGTDRCAEVARMFPDFEIVVNIQGDEPFINPMQIEKLVQCFEKPSTEIATLVKRIEQEDDLWNQNTPKVILNGIGEALYFSRATIPHLRGEEVSNWFKKQTYYKHIGIYAYKAEILQQITALTPSSLERAEALEQLRWLENGYKVQTAITDLETIAIDTPEDLNKLASLL